MSAFRRVLLLNSSEEVIDLISWRRGATLLFQGKVRKPFGHEDAYEISTVAGIFKLPTALVLVQYVRLPFKKLAVSRDNILKRDSHECQYCGKRISGSDGTIDHVFPQSRAGKNVWANVVAACKACNNRKANQTPLEAGMKLRCRPYTPTRDVLLLKAIDLRTHQTWTRWVVI